MVGNEQNAEWFEEWFNTSYYHLLYGNRSEKEAADFIDNLINYLGLSAHSKILDLACGKGRHSLQLNTKGFSVIGVDLSEKSIEQAKKLSNDSLEFFVHDMRQLFWLEHFNLVVNLFTSFGYFHNAEDDQKTMDGIYDALKPGGRLVIDFMNAKKVIANLVPIEEKVLDGVTFKLLRAVSENIVTKTIEVFDGHKHFKFMEEVDLLTFEDFRLLLSNAELTIESVFGNYKLDPFDEVTSDRLIIIARKA